MSDKETIKQIIIFDMDGTLVLTPDKKMCEGVWWDKFNVKWPYKGVFSKRESLDFTIFNIPIIQSIVDEHRKVYRSPNIHVVLLTGRLLKLINEVKKLLDYHELYFDEYLLNDKSNTLDFKLFELKRLYDEFPNVEEIIFFDDRDEHIPSFINLGKELEEKALKSGKLLKFIMRHVKVSV